MKRTIPSHSQPFIYDNSISKKLFIPLKSKIFIWISDNVGEWFLLCIVNGQYNQINRRNKANCAFAQIIMIPRPKELSIVLRKQLNLL